MRQRLCNDCDWHLAAESASGKVFRWSGPSGPVKGRRDLRPLTPLSSHHMQVSLLKIYTLGAAVAPPQGEPGRARAPSGTRGKAEAPLGRGRPARDAVAEPHRPGHWSATLAFVRHSASRGWARFGIVGVAAAIANAIYHAIGKRVRDLPITLDKLQR